MFCQFADGAFLQNNLYCFIDKNLKEYAKKVATEAKT